MDSTEVRLHQVRYQMRSTKPNGKDIFMIFLRYVRGHTRQTETDPPPCPCASESGRPMRHTHHIKSGADPENELGGGQLRGSGGQKSPSGVQGRSPGRGTEGRSPPEADDFSQLKGYLDVTSGILGGMAPLPPPLYPPVH